jgi:hypothetical protein
MRKILPIFILAFTITALSAPARADVLDDVGAKLDIVGAKLNGQLSGLWNFLGSSQPETGKRDAPAVTPMPAIQLTPTPLAPRALAGLGLDDVRAPAISLAPELVQEPAPAPVVAVLPEPSVEKTLKKLFCVEYARAVSGLAIFGDAKTWWTKAKTLYARTARPLEQAVMVFSGSARLKSGHVAVVTNIVSPREIRVEQANWMNKGEIDHATKVMDVSARNDWSKVRVWDVPSHAYGSRIYAISGFIVNQVRPAAPDVREASNN